MKFTQLLVLVSLALACGEPLYKKFNNDEKENMGKIGENTSNEGSQESQKDSSEKTRENSSDLSKHSFSFKEVKNKIFAQNCISCHPQYSDYNSVFQNKNAVLDAVLKNRMPPNSEGLPDTLKKILQTWIDAGAPESVIVQNPVDEPGMGDEGGEGDELMATWSSVSKNIIFPKCVQCHNPNGVASFADLTTREKLLEQKDYLIGDFSKADESLLIEVITDPLEPMPPQRSGLDRLTESEVDIFREWVEKGLPL